MDHPETLVSVRGDAPSTRTRRGRARLQAKQAAAGAGAPPPPPPTRSSTSTTCPPPPHLCSTKSSPSSSSTPLPACATAPPCAACAPWPRPSWCTTTTHGKGENARETGKKSAPTPSHPPPRPKIYIFPSLLSPQLRRLPPHPAWRGLPRPARPRVGRPPGGRGPPDRGGQGGGRVCGDGPRRVAGRHQAAPPRPDVLPGGRPGKARLRDAQGPGRSFLAPPVPPGRHQGGGLHGRPARGGLRRARPPGRQPARSAHDTRGGHAPLPGRPLLRGPEAAGPGVRAGGRVCGGPGGAGAGPLRPERVQLDGARKKEREKQGVRARESKSKSKNSPSLLLDRSTTWKI